MFFPFIYSLSSVWGNTDRWGKHEDTQYKFTSEGF